MLTEIRNVAQDIRTGALPPAEIPGYVIFLVTRPLGLACIGIAILGGFAAALLSR
jgi:hypothetical protein